MDRHQKVPAPPLNPGRLFYGWVLVGVFAIIMLTFWSTYSSFGVFLPSLSEQFGWSRGTISLALTINLLLGGALALALGSLADRYGPRLIMGLSAGFLGLAFLALSRLNALWQLYLLMGVVAGVGMAGGYIVPTTTISRWFRARRGLALGIILAAVGLGYMIGPPIAASLVRSFDWRTSYLFLGVAILALPLPLSLALKRAPEDIGLVPWGGETTARIIPDPPKSPGPSLRGILNRPVFWIVFFAWMSMGFAMMMVVVHIVPYAVDRGIGLPQAATALTLYGLSSVVGRMSFGFLTDRYGVKAAFALGTAFQGVALLGLVAPGGLAGFYAIAFLFGLGAAGADTAVLKTIPDLFGTAILGAVMGALAPGWRLGAASGPPLAGFLYDMRGLYPLAFLLAAVFVLGAGVPFLLSLRGGEAQRTSSIR